EHCHARRLAAAACDHGEAWRRCRLEDEANVVDLAGLARQAELDDQSARVRCASRKKGNQQRRPTLATTNGEGKEKENEAPDAARLILGDRTSRICERRRNRGWRRTGLVRRANAGTLHAHACRRAAADGCAGAPVRSRLGCACSRIAGQSADAERLTT